MKFAIHTDPKLALAVEAPREKPALEPFCVTEASRALNNAAAGFAPISLEEMQEVALLDRIDTKFALPAAQLAALLIDLQKDYRVLVVQGNRLSEYRTLYFDTPDFALYLAHATERANRYKVRMREYVASRISFLEVKHKTSKERTIKERIKTRQPTTRLTAEMDGWLHSVSPLSGEMLEPKLWNTFRRMTLVSVRHGERVTIDVDLAFFTQDRLARLDGLAVVEVKCAGKRSLSPFLAQMRAHRVLPRSFSKYSIGVGLLVDDIKKNKLKAKLLWLQRHMREIQRELAAGAALPERQWQTS